MCGSNIAGKGIISNDLILSRHHYVAFTCTQCAGADTYRCIITPFFSSFSEVTFHQVSDKMPFSHFSREIIYWKVFIGRRFICVTFFNKF